MVSRCPTIVALVVAALVVVAAPPAAAQAQLDGVAMHPFWDGVSRREAARELDVAQRAGAQVVRIDIAWSSLELAGKGRISRDYAGRVATFLRDARARRIEVIATLIETPCWASSAPARLRRRCAGEWWDRGVTRYPPRRARDYADAAAYVAERWGGLLTALEIWNEPNAPNFLVSADAVRDYARLVRASYRPVKRAAPRLTVLAGALAQAHGDFLAELYDRGGIAGDYDAISYHPYTDGSDPRIVDSERGRAWSPIAGTEWLHEVMAAHGDARGELWATEAGVSTCSSGARCVDERTQADYVAGYLTLARRLPYLRAMVIYSLRDNGTDPTDPEDRFGLVRFDLRPKPALAAFRAAAAG
jgi:polysaccharide biosynthesis protein PslG